MRMEAVFVKGERLRHIGHLDLMRAMLRALRRSELPISYSKGFNPHVLLTFASALSTGAWGKREILEAALDTPVTAEEFIAAMNKALPEDLRILEAKSLEDRHIALMAAVEAASYTLTVTDAAAAEKLCAQLPAFLEKESVTAIRRTKSGMKETDIRPLTYELSMAGQTLTATLALTESATCKPEMLVAALSEMAQMEPPRYLTCREALLGRDATGALKPLETL